MGVLGENSGHRKAEDQHSFVNKHCGSAKCGPGEPIVGFRMSNEGLMFRGYSVGSRRSGTFLGILILFEFCCDEVAETLPTVRDLDLLSRGSKAKRRSLYSYLNDCWQSEEPWGPHSTI